MEINHLQRGHSLKVEHPDHGVGWIHPGILYLIRFDDYWERTDDTQAIKRFIDKCTDVEVRPK